MECDGPLEIGTEVSAKFRGAFCEAIVRESTNDIHVHVKFVDKSFASKIVPIQDIRGNVALGGLVQGPTGGQRGQFDDCIITKIFDHSVYQVEFDDGDLKRLKRNNIRHKGRAYFTNGQTTIESLPLMDPEKFAALPPRSSRRKGSNSPITRSPRNFDIGDITSMSPQRSTRNGLSRTTSGSTTSRTTLTGNGNAFVPLRTSRPRSSSILSRGIRGGDVSGDETVHKAVSVTSLASSKSDTNIVNSMSDDTRTKGLGKLQSRSSRSSVSSTSTSSIHDKLSPTLPNSFARLTPTASRTRPKSTVVPSTSTSVGATTTEALHARQTSLAGMAVFVEPLVTHAASYWHTAIVVPFACINATVMHIENPSMGSCVVRFFKDGLYRCVPEACLRKFSDATPLFRLFVKQHRGFLTEPEIIAASAFVKTNVLSTSMTWPGFTPLKKCQIDFNSDDESDSSSDVNSSAEVVTKLSRKRRTISANSSSSDVTLSELGSTTGKKPRVYSHTTNITGDDDDSANSLSRRSRRSQSYSLPEVMITENGLMGDDTAVTATRRKRVRGSTERTTTPTPQELEVLYNNQWKYKKDDHVWAMSYVDGQVYEAKVMHRKLMSNSRDGRRNRQQTSNSYRHQPTPHYQIHYVRWATDRYDEWIQEEHVFDSNPQGKPTTRPRHRATSELSVASDESSEKAEHSDIGDDDSVDGVKQKKIDKQSGMQETREMKINTNSEMPNPSVSLNGDQKRESNVENDEPASVNIRKCDDDMKEDSMLDDDNERVDVNTIAEVTKDKKDSIAKSKKHVVGVVRASVSVSVQAAVVVLTDEEGSNTSRVTGKSSDVVESSSKADPISAPVVVDPGDDQKEAIETRTSAKSKQKRNRSLHTETVSNTTLPESIPQTEPSIANDTTVPDELGSMDVNIRMGTKASAQGNSADGRSQELKRKRKNEKASSKRKVGDNCVVSGGSATIPAHTSTQDESVSRPTPKGCVLHDSTTTAKDISRSSSKSPTATDEDLPVSTLNDAIRDIHEININECANTPKPIPLTSGVPSASNLIVEEVLPIPSTNASSTLPKKETEILNDVPVEISCCVESNVEAESVTTPTLTKLSSNSATKRGEQRNDSSTEKTANSGIAENPDTLPAMAKATADRKSLSPPPAEEVSAAPPSTLDGNEGTKSTYKSNTSPKVKQEPSTSEKYKFAPKSPKDSTVPDTKGACAMDKATTCATGGDSNDKENSANGASSYTVYTSTTTHKQEMGDGMTLTKEEFKVQHTLDKGGVTISNQQIHEVKHTVEKSSISPHVVLTADGGLELSTLEDRMRELKQQYLAHKAELARLERLKRIKREAVASSISSTGAHVQTVSESSEHRIDNNESTNAEKNNHRSTIDNTHGNINVNCMKQVPVKQE
eukprot:CFRG0119T1